MSKVIVINPSAIAEGDIQNVTPDISKFDFAKVQVGLVVSELTPLFKITSDEQVATALEKLKLAKEVDKAIEEKRKQIVGPWNAGVTEINQYKKTLVEDLTTSIDKVKEAVLAYQKEKEKRAKEELITARQGQLAALGFTYNSQSNLYMREYVGSMTNGEISNYDANTWNTVINGFTESISRISRQQIAQLEEEKELLEIFGSEDQKADADTQLSNAKKVSGPIIGAYIPAFGPSKVKGTTKRWDFDIIDKDLIPREYLIVDETAIRKALAAGIRQIPGAHIYQKESLSIR